MRLFFRDDAAGERPEVADAQGLLDRHIPGAPRIRSAENRACFSLHHRVASRFRSGRVLLAGDAAHAMTPVNGQGMNTGLQDAYNLAWKLRLALAGVPAAVLDSYEAERRLLALATVQASGEVHDANVLRGAAAGALGVLPGQRIPDAGPLIRADGSPTSLREVLRSPELQLWICAGTAPAESALALAERFTPAVRPRCS